MDSSEVNKRIKRVIKPFLLANGFTINTSRNFWKQNDENIFVVNFQSFNSYNANVMDVTTFSFSINLGIYWTKLPHIRKLKEKSGFTMPEEVDCTIRHSLKKNLRQSETSINNVWFVDKEGKNLDNVIDDALISLEKFSPEWFKNLSDKRNCLKFLQKAEEDMQGTFGFGNKNSPRRNFLIGYFSY